MIELLDQLKKLPKEVLMLIIFDLMKDEVITYHEVTEAHIKYLKMLHDGATDDYYEGRIEFTDSTRVKFSFGYTKKTMTYKITDIVLGKGNPEWGALDKEVFIIKLGKRVA